MITVQALHTRSSRRDSIGVAILFVSLLAFSGCGESQPHNHHGSHAAHHGHAHAESAPWHFVDGRGVLLTEAGKANLGLQTGSVRPASTQSHVEGTIALPFSALLQTVRGDFVYVQNGDYFFRSPVQLGRRSAEAVEVVEGLFEGDVVALAGADMLWLTELQAINGGAACTDGH